VQKLPVFYWVLDGNSRLNSAVGAHLLIQLITLRWFTSSTCRHLPNWPTSLALIAGSVPITSAVGDDAKTSASGFQHLSESSDDVYRIKSTDIGCSTHFSDILSTWLEINGLN
jgi:hypothetical protein